MPCIQPLEDMKTKVIRFYAGMFCVPTLTRVSVVLLILLHSVFANGQDTLQGSIEVGQGKRYTTIRAAAQAYNTGMLTGHVVFLLTDSLYASSETFPITFASNATASSSRTLTIRPASGMHVEIRGSVSNNPLFIISGSHIHINGSNADSNTRDLSVTNTNIDPFVFPRVLNFSSVGNQYVENCSIRNTVLTNGNDRSVISLSSVTSTSTSGFFRNIAIENNVFNRSLYGIFAVAKVVAGNGSGLHILNNDMSTGGSNAIRYSAIYLRGVDSARISGNKIGRFTGTDSATDRGIWLADSTRNVTIDGNEIFSLNHTGNKGCGAIGILVATGMANANVTIVNNMIHGISGDGNDLSVTSTTSNNPTGILIDNAIASQAGIRILFNSIYLGGEPGFSNTLNRTNAVSSCIRLRGSSTAEIRNNILINALGLAGTAGRGSFCISATQASNFRDSINQNIYFNATTGNGVKSIGYLFNTSAEYNNLSAWQGFTGKDGHSFQVLPNFVGYNDLRPTDDNQSINNKGKFIAGFNTDFQGAVRSTQHPDIGCFEFNAGGQRTWTGLVSSNWNDPANWSGIQPVNDTTDFYIDQTRIFTPIITDTVSIRNLVLDFPTDTMLLQLDSGACLRLRGQLTRVRGRVAASTAALEFIGTTTQAIPEGAFQSNQLGELIVSNSSTEGVRLDGQLEILRQVAFTDSGQVLNTQGNLVLKSTINRTARLGNLTGKSIIGDVTVEQFVPAGIFHGRAWHLLAVPLYGNQTIRQAWQESATTIGSNPASGFGTMMTSSDSNALANGYDRFTSTGGTLLYFDSTQQRFLPVPSTFQPLSDEAAYLVLIRGDRSATTFNSPVVPTVLRAKGTVYNASNTLTAPSVNVAAGKFQLLGNRLPSPINWTQLSKSGDLDDVFYAWDPELGSLGNYQTISGLNGYLPVPGGTRLYSGSSPVTTIDPGKAFFVRGSTGGVGATVAFPESAKTTNALSGRAMTSRQPIGISVKLFWMQQTQDARLMDGCQLLETGSDNGAGLVKLLGNEEQISIATSGQYWSVKSKPVVSDPDTVFLNLHGLKYRNYRIAFQHQRSIDPLDKWFIFDRITNQEIPMPDSGYCQYDFSVQANTIRQSASRFILYKRSARVLPITDVRLDGRVLPNGKHVLSIKSTDWSGIAGINLEYSVDSREFIPLNNWNQPNGSISMVNTPASNQTSYRLKLIDFSGQFLYSPTLVLRNEKKNQQMNAVRKGGQLCIQYQMGAPSAGVLRVFDPSGKVIKKMKINSLNGFNELNISMPSSLPNGVFPIELKHQEGDVLSTRVLW